MDLTNSLFGSSLILFTVCTEVRNNQMVFSLLSGTGVSDDRSRPRGFIQGDAGHREHDQYQKYRVLQAGRVASHQYSGPRHPRLRLYGSGGQRERRRNRAGPGALITRDYCRKIVEKSFTVGPKRILFREIGFSSVFNALFLKTGELLLSAYYPTLRNSF